MNLFKKMTLIVVSCFSVSTASAVVCVEPFSCILLALGIDNVNTGYQFTDEEIADVQALNTAQANCPSVGSRVYTNTRRIFKVLLTCEMMIEIGQLAEEYHSNLEDENARLKEAGVETKPNYDLNYYDRFVMAAFLNSIGLMPSSVEFGVDGYFTSPWNIQMEPETKQVVIQDVRDRIVFSDIMAFAKNLVGSRCFQHSADYCPLNEYQGMPDK